MTRAHAAVGKNTRSAAGDNSTTKLRDGGCWHTIPAQRFEAYTTDLKQGLLDQNAAKCPHTAKHLPWKVKFYAAFETLDSPNGSRLL
jgi:hypothetical protein